MFSLTGEAPAQSASARPPLYVVVHKSNPVTNLSVEQIRRFVLGEERAWPNKEKVTVVEQDQTSLSFQRVLESVLRMSPAEFARLTVGATFRGQEVLPIKTLHSEQSAAKFVFNVPGAIAFLCEPPAPALSEGLRVLRVESHLPGEPGYALR